MVILSLLDIRVNRKDHIFARTGVSATVAIIPAHKINSMMVLLTEVAPRDH